MSMQFAKHDGRAFKHLPGTDSQPAVSVLLAVRNGMPHLEEAVRSILDQSFTNLELVVVDNGSSDGSSEFLRALSDKRIRYLSYSPAGLAGALNYGLQRTRAQLIARMDADDLALPGRLEAQFDYMQKHSECVLLGSAFDMIDDVGKVTGSAINVIHDEVIRWAMLFFNPFLHSGVMFRRKSVDRCGGYDESFAVAQDFDLWRRLSSEGNMHNLEAVLSHKRYSPSSTTGQSSEKQLDYAARTVKEYTASYAPQLDADLLVCLRNWYIDDYCLPPKMASELPALLNQSVGLLRGIASYEARSEAHRLELHMREMLRFRSHCAARGNLFRPWKAVEFLRVGQRFDPGAGGLLVRMWRWWMRSIRASSEA